MSAEGIVEHFGKYMLSDCTLDGKIDTRMSIKYGATTSSRLDDFSIKGGVCDTGERLLMFTGWHGFRQALLSVNMMASECFGFMS